MSDKYFIQKLVIMIWMNIFRCYINEHIVVKAGSKEVLLIVILAEIILCEVVFVYISNQIIF